MDSNKKLLLLPNRFQLVGWIVAAAAAVCVACALLLSKIERAVKRISQQELAEAVGVSRQTIYAIENDKFIPSTELALKLSAYFGKTVNELFSLD